MTMDDNSQQRCYIFALKVIDTSPNLDKMLSNMQILSRLYSFDNEEVVLQKKIDKIIIKIKDFRKHKVIRKQEVITDLKVEIDDLLAEMMRTISAKNMQMVNAFDMN